MEAQTREEIAWTFVVDGVDCEAVLHNDCYSVSTVFGGRTFAEVFDLDNTIEEVQYKFKTLFRGSKSRLRKRISFLREIWKKQGITREVFDF